MKTEFIQQAEQLISELSVIEDRHLLEILAVHSGLKNVMRIHMSNKEEYRILETFCINNSFHLAHSDFRLKLSWTNEIGDRFYEDVPWEDTSADEFIAYFTKNDLESLARSISVEREGTHKEAGLLYGYPRCCCENYESISNGEEWVDVLSKNSQGTFFSPWSNKLAYLVHGFTLFPDYFPCGYSCASTIELSKKYFRLGESYNLGSFVKNQFNLMSRTYFVAQDSIISFEGAKVVNDMLHLSTQNRGVYGKDFTEGFLRDYFTISLPKENECCFWKWGDSTYRVFVFSDAEDLKH
jgi:hypothetical protein